MIDDPGMQAASEDAALAWDRVVLEERRQLRERVDAALVRLREVEAELEEVSLELTDGASE